MYEIIDRHDLLSLYRKKSIGASIMQNKKQKRKLYHREDS